VASCRVNFAFLPFILVCAPHSVWGFLRGASIISGLFTLAESNCVFAGGAGALTSCLCIFVRLHEPGLTQCKRAEPWVMVGRWTSAPQVGYLKSLNAVSNNHGEERKGR